MVASQVRINLRITRGVQSDRYDRGEIHHRGGESTAINISAVSDDSKAYRRTFINFGYSCPSRRW